MGKFQAISGPGQIKFKSPGFPGSAGNHVIMLKCAQDTIACHSKRVQYTIIANASLWHSGQVKLLMIKTRYKAKTKQQNNN